MNDKYPRIERGPLIEVPRLCKGRPGYAWVEGWIVKYSETRQSIPYQLAEARALLKETKT